MLSSLRPHSARFDETTVYFTFATAHSPTDLRALADRLLEAGIAETVSSPLDGDVRLAPRYKAMLPLMARAARAGAAVKASSDGTWREFVQMYPVRGRALYARAWWSVTVARLRPRAQREPEEWDDSDIPAQMLKVISDIEDGVARRQSIAAIQQARDADIFRPAYLESEPFLRLTLRHANLDIQPARGLDVPSEPQRVDPLLTLHRSGVILLTIAIQLPSPLSSQQLVQQSHASDVEIGWSEISEPILEYAARLYPKAELAGSWLHGMSEGVRWMHFDEGEESIQLVRFLTLYWDAIVSAGQLRSIGEWQIYPTACVDQIECCHSEKRWRRRHGDELAALLLKWDGSDRLRRTARTAVPEDSSLTKYSSDWHSVGSAVRINWVRDHAPMFDDHLWTLSLIESFLLQHWQIRSLLAEVSASTSNVKTVRELQRRLIGGLDEYYQSALSYASAQAQVEKLLDESGSSRAHAQLLSRVDQLSSMLASERAEKTASRGLTIAIGGVLLAAIFGLPAISQTVQVAQQIPPDSRAYGTAAPVRWLGELGPAGSWYAFLAMLIVLCMVLATTVRPRVKITRRRRRPMAGYRWPLGTIPVVRRAADSAE